MVVVGERERPGNNTEGARTTGGIQPSTSEENTAQQRLRSRFQKKKEPSANCAVYLRFFIRILGSEPTLAFSLKAGLVDETTAILLLSKAS